MQSFYFTNVVHPYDKLLLDQSVDFHELIDQFVSEATKINGLKERFTGEGNPCEKFCKYVTELKTAKLKLEEGYRTRILRTELEKNEDKP